MRAIMVCIWSSVILGIVCLSSISSNNGIITAINCNIAYIILFFIIYTGMKDKMGISLEDISKHKSSLFTACIGLIIIAGTSIWLSVDFLTSQAFIKENSSDLLTLIKIIRIRLGPIFFNLIGSSMIVSATISADEEKRRLKP